MVIFRTLTSLLCIHLPVDGSNVGQSQLFALFECIVALECCMVTHITVVTRITVTRITVFMGSPQRDTWYIFHFFIFLFLYTSTRSKICNIRGKKYTSREIMLKNVNFGNSHYILNGIFTRFCPIMDVAMHYGYFLHIEKSAVHVFNVLYWSRSIVCRLWHWNVVWSLALEW